MTRRLWFIIDPITGGYRLSKPPEGGGIPPNPHVTIREADDEVIYAGVWINGERSYDTHILVNGDPILHSPVASVGSTTFEMHEQRGGGHEL